MHNVHIPITEEDLLDGIAHIPNKQLNLYKRALVETIGATDINDDELKSQIMFLLVTNPICVSCLKKDPATLKKLKLCNKCHIEWYCGDQCRQNHLPIHSKYCQNVDGDWPENSPHAPGIIRLKK